MSVARHPGRQVARRAPALLLLLLAACTTTVKHQATVQERSPVLSNSARPSVATPPAARAPEPRAEGKPAAVDKPAPAGAPVPSPSVGARAGTEDPVAVASPLRSEAAPGASAVAPSAPAAPTAPAGSAATAATAAAAASVPAVQWGWPVDVPVSQPFSDALKGVDFAGTLGTPVRAAAAGTVSFVGSSLRGYGRMVVLKHEHGYLSVYAHNRQVRVKEGDRVARAQVIADMGNSDSDGVMLHFEVRHLGKPVDPVQVLPARNPAGH